MTNKKAQVTLWVIIALFIIAAVVLYTIFSGKIGGERIPREFSPVYSYYEECILQAGKNALYIAESQGGHIYNIENIPGSDYAPFSSNLNFLGVNIPYWFYLTGNGVAKEKVPSKDEIASEISRYIKEKIAECDFQEFERQGFLINLTEPAVQTSIELDRVVVNVDSNLMVSKEGANAERRKHKIEIDSKFGNLYEEAKRIYNKEQKESFLENYSVDVLRLYAPVDGVIVDCAPKVWKTREVVSELKEALENNIMALRVGEIKDTKNAKEKYFTIPFNKKVDSINFLYNKNWPGRVEIYGADQELMVAEPIGNQEGLGILGFCYAPYHFVYDVSFPVLIQLMSGDEIFQFPVVVIIDKNLPKQGIYSNISEVIGNENLPNFCEFPNKDVTVRLFNKNLEKVDGEVNFLCFDQRCSVGRTTDGSIEGKIPACLNGQLEVNAEGYAPKKMLFSSNSERFADIILDKEYQVNISLKVGGKPFDGIAFVLIKGPDFIRSANLPDMKEIKISEGMYNITVYVYSNDSLTIPESKKTQCVDVARSGLLGLFGSTRQECVEITLPETKIEYALIGGGRGENYLLESDLEKGNLVLEVEELPIPKTLEELQQNYYNFDGLKVNVGT